MAYFHGVRVKEIPTSILATVSTTACCIRHGACSSDQGTGKIRKQACHLLQLG